MKRLAVLFLFVTLGCACTVDGPTAKEFAWNLPAGFPLPVIPADNPMTSAKVELGRHLFFDVRLSNNQTTSCATCHDPIRAFTDGRAQAIGATGQVHPRGALSLTNVAYNTTYGWANPTLTSLEVQIPVPMFNERPVELGLTGRESQMLERLKAELRYGELFSAAFPGEVDPVTLKNVTYALACFERTMISGASPYDLATYGRRPDAMTESAKRGQALFFSERTECFHCHGGFNFADSVNHQGTTFREAMFHNTGLYNVGGQGDFPSSNQGLFDFTMNTADKGKMKAPTLRNVALTAPYMHDGTIATLSQVVDFYAAGGRFVTDGPYAGDGRASPQKSGFVRGFLLDDSEREDLIHFLESLTDTSFVSNAQFQNPWTSP